MVNYYCESMSSSSINAGTFELDTNGKSEIDVLNQTAQNIITTTQHLQSLTNQASILRKTKIRNNDWLVNYLGSLSDKDMGEEQSRRLANGLVVTRVEKTMSKTIDNSCLEFIISKMETNVNDSMHRLDQIKDYMKEYWERNKAKYAKQKKYKRLYKIIIRNKDQFIKDRDKKQKKLDDEAKLLMEKKRTMDDDEIEQERIQEIEQKREKIKERFLKLYKEREDYMFESGNNMNNNLLYGSSIM